MADTNKMLEQVLRAIEKIAMPIPAIPQIPAIPPILPIPPIPAIPQIILSDDHNLLIKLDSKVDALKEDIKMLSDSSSDKIDDHEDRIRELEKQTTANETTRKLVYGCVGLILTTTISALIYLIIYH